jgi:hypothetical protein
LRERRERLAWLTEHHETIANHLIHVRVARGETVAPPLQASRLGK